MSSSDPDAEPLFVVQSGIVAWEDPMPIVDWHSKTVTLCAPQMSMLVSLLWVLVASRPSSLAQVFRVHLAEISGPHGPTQQRRLVTLLKKDPPGFTSTVSRLLKGRVCVVSKLDAPSSVDLQYLSSYRHTALVEVDADIESTDALCNLLWGKIGDLGGASICALRSLDFQCAIIRILEVGRCAVMQLVGSPDVADAGVRALLDARVRQAMDVRALPEEISRWRR